jgi:hypothetical protein
VDSLIANPAGGYLILYFHDVEDDSSSSAPTSVESPEDCYYHERIVDYVASKVAQHQVVVVTEEQAVAILKGVTGIADDY